MSLPSCRPSSTISPRIVGPEGSHRVHITMGRASLAAPISEVWIDMHKEGSVLRGFAHALARLASLALQHGVPLAVVVHALRGTDGGPSGAVEDGPEGVTEADSVPDLVGRVLEKEGGEPMASPHEVKG